MEITLYSTHCPKCEVLKKKLDATGLEYKIIDDTKEVVKIGRENNILSAPILIVDSRAMDFTTANKYITDPIVVK